MKDVNACMLCDQYLVKLGVSRDTRQWVMAEVIKDDTMPPMAKMQSCLNLLSGDELQTRLSIIFPSLSEYEHINEHLRALAPKINRSSMSSTFKTRSVPSFFKENAVRMWKNVSAHMSHKVRTVSVTY